MLFTKHPYGTPLIRGAAPRIKNIQSFLFTIIINAPSISQKQRLVIKSGQL
jgi:hypothetical protein